MHLRLNFCAKAAVDKAALPDDTRWIDRIFFSIAFKTIIKLSLSLKQLLGFRSSCFTQIFVYPSNLPKLLILIKGVLKEY